MSILVLVISPVLAGEIRYAGDDSATIMQNLPVSFIPNHGQVDGAVAFQVKGGDHEIHFLSNEMRLLTGDSSSSRSGDIRQVFLASNPDAAIVGIEPLPGYANFFTGTDASSWLTDIPTYRSIVYRDLYPGIDLVYSAANGTLKREFRIAPGANPGAIVSSYEGAGAISVRTDGSLALSTPAGTFVETALLCYQSVDGERRSVQAAYEIRDDRTVRFVIGDYDAGLPLVIDPVLAFGTYAGGGAQDQGHSLDIDSQGNIVITGETYGSFPVTGSVPQSSFGGDRDVFVEKVSPDGSTVLFATYLGGPHGDEATEVDIGPDDAIFLAAHTWGTFPVTEGAFQTTKPSGDYGIDGVVVKLASQGNSLLYSTYLGGANGESPYGIAVDAGGNAYVTGWADAGFPLCNPIQEYAGQGTGYDVFIAKLNPAGSALVYSTYFGGPAYELGYDIAVDGPGRAYVTGAKEISSVVMNAVQSASADGSSGVPTDAFVVKLTPDGTGFVYTKTLGGGGNDIGYAVAPDSAGNAVIVGTTEGGFPVAGNACQTDFGGGVDIFVARLATDGASLAYATYLGGSGDDFGRGLALDASGNVYVAGGTTGDFPIRNPAQAAPGGSDDGIIAKLSPDGASLLFSTYLGGSASETCSDIALDSAGNVYATGSTHGGFPTTVNAVQKDFGGVVDAFIVKLTNQPPSAVDDSYAVDEGGILSVAAPGVLANDVFDPATGATATVATNPAYGTLALGADGSFSYTPLADFNGVDTFTYVIASGSQTGDTATVTIAVTPANRAPELETIGDKTVSENAKLEFTVSASDPDAGGTLIFSAGNLPSGATFDPASKTFTWTPTSTQAGTYPGVRFGVTDGALTDVEEITITVGNVNSAPTSTGQSVITDEDTPISMTLAGDDPDGDSVTFTVVDGPSHGTLSGTAPALSYAPSENYHGSDSFTFTVSDGLATSPPATVTITVSDVNDLPTAAFTLAPDAPTTLDAVAFTDASTDIDGTIVGWSWSFGDGATSTGQHPTHTYAAAGAFAVRLTVMDTSSGTASVEKTVTVTAGNRAPVVDGGSDLAGTEGTAISFTGSFTDEGDTGAHIIAWDFGDGGSAADTLTPSHTYADDGTYTVALTVTDTSGLSATDTLVVKVANAAPVVEAGGELSGAAGESIVFSGSFTDAGTADTQTFAWSFGDGATSTGQNPSHSYASAGTYIATLTVTDDDGGTGTGTVLVKVADAAPAAQADAYTTAEDQPLTVLAPGVLGNDDAGPTATAAVATNPSHGTLALGADGSFTYTPLADFNGEDTFTYTIASGSQTSDPATVTIAITGVNDLPTAALTVAPAAPTTFDAVVFTDTSTDPDGTIVGWSWAFGDGGSSTDRNPTHTYAAAGAYAVRLTVTDNSSGTASVEKTVTVTAGGSGSVVSAGDDLTGVEGTPVVFRGTWTGDGRIRRIAWDFGDGHRDSGTLTPSHTYRDNGVYTVTLTVTDAARNTFSDTLVVTVANAAPVVSGVTVPEEPVTVQATVQASANFTDQGAADTHTATWTWGDGTSSIGRVMRGRVAGSHTYAAAGVYLVNVTVTDDDGGTGTATAESDVVVAEPTGGAVFGAGWFRSSAASSTVAAHGGHGGSDRTIFGFVAEYPRNGGVPTGQVRIRDRAGALSFRSTGLEALTVVGTTARITGTGQVNRTGSYGFLVTVTDSPRRGRQGADLIRVRIWEKVSGAVVFDTQPGAVDTADPTTAIAGGAISIRRV
jgi:VCBS repeat-containing protein